MTAFEVKHFCPACGKRLPFNGFVVLVRTRCPDCRKWVVVNSSGAMAEEDYKKRE